MACSSCGSDEAARKSLANAGLISYGWYWLWLWLRLRLLLVVVVVVVPVPSVNATLPRSKFSKPLTNQLFVNTY